MSNLRKIAAYSKPYRRMIVAGVILLFASVLIGLMVPWMIGRAIDDLRAGINLGKLGLYVLLILGVKGASGTFWFLQLRMLVGASRNVEYDLRRDFYNHLQWQPLSFFQSHRIGDLMTRATSDVDGIRQLVAPLIMYLLQAVFTVAITLPLLIGISLRLTLLVLVPLPLVTLTAKYFGQQVHKKFKEAQSVFAQISTHAQEGITGVRMMRAFAQEEAQLAAFNKLNRLYSNANHSVVRSSAVIQPLMKFLVGMGYVLIVWYGSILTVRGDMTVGQFVAFNLYLGWLIWPLTSIGYAINIYQRGTACLKRYLAILAVKPAIEDSPEVREQPVINGCIEFRSLTFRPHPEAEPVLRNISLGIEAGQTIGFVGRTGAGKSTLVNLIPRLLEAPAGSLFIDGVSVRDYPLAQLRASIGYVPQETFLFSGTLAENIAYGVEQAERADIEWVAEVAGLTDDVRGFPDGLDVFVGERGLTLSGGQKQRTAIARAVLRRPKILILDDALSSVDTCTEEKVLARLRGLMRERTSLIVSHRVSTVRDADLICVLDGGEIAERGTHEQLLALGSHYASLYRRQMLEEEERVEFP